eukprot:11898299-Heterocapsa_arctica.AAC.1
MNDKLSKLKAKSKCHACGQIGHWVGDKDCPQRGSSSSGGKGSYSGRLGGFLRRAGLASTTLFMLLKIVIAIPIDHFNDNFNEWRNDTYDYNFNGNYTDVFATSL